MSKMRWFAAGTAAGLVAAAAAASFVVGGGAAVAEEQAAYVGDKVCMACHLQEHKAWKLTKLAGAMKALAPTDEAADKALFDRKTANGVDPAKDYTADPACLKCHTTGYGTATGYPDPTTLAGDEKAAKRAKAFGAVGCEACHGAGSKYVAFKKADANKARKDIPFEELAPLGLVKPDEAVCKTCHEAGGPTKEKFDFAASRTKTHPKPEKEEPK
jgi:hypothetical protein